jgi:hypothetical protein
MDAVASLLPETSIPEDRDRSDDIRGNPDMPRALTMAMGRRSFMKHPDITRHRLSFMAPVITVLDITVLDIMVLGGVGEGDGENRRTRQGLIGWRKESSRRRCYRSRLIKTPDQISERPPRGGLFFVCVQ